MLPQQLAKKKKSEQKKNERKKNRHFCELWGIRTPALKKSFRKVRHHDVYRINNDVCCAWWMDMEVCVGQVNKYGPLLLYNKSLKMLRN